MTGATHQSDRATHPYVGLRPYDRGEHALFFGREREGRDIATIWQATGLTVLFGASGVGKTSLLHAGVLPRIEPERADVLPVARVSPRGIVSLRPRVTGNPYALALLSAWAPEEPLPVLAGLTVSDFLAGRPERVDRYGDPVPTLVAVDQAEELFGGPPDREEERHALLRQLASAVEEHDGLHLLLSLREEYLASVLPYERPLGRGSRARFQLLPLSRAAALDATTRPLERTGRSFAPGAAERLVDDLRTVPFLNDEGQTTTVTLNTVEPVQLQVVCSALWDSLPPGLREITTEHVNLHVNVDHFLTGFCERMLAQVAAESGVTSSEIRSWLRRTFVTEHGTRNTVYEGLCETAGMPNAIAEALEDRHLLRGEHRLGIRWYELQHDRLIGSVRQSQHPATYLGDARAALARGSWETARGLAEEAVRASGPGETWVRAEALVVLGEVAAVGGEVEGARRLLEEAADVFATLQRFDGVASALTAEGRLWLAQGRYDRAVEQLRAALSWVPNDLPAQLALGEALWHLGQPRAALALLNGAVALASEPPAEALALRGEILADLGRPGEALRDLDRVRRHQRPTTIAARALALALAQRFDAAGQEILDATADESDSGPVLLRAARVHALLGQRATAEEFASRALDAVTPGLPPHLRKQAEEFLRKTA
ncbi:tetratricopeptide repeat protein [Streptosporangium sp. NBC_01755]|uniref:tetratricopeptide repeat protein n=1 Tax=Streptosporangium sp. NBC_01755 TaxID=2975949 RepID=UPI002DD87869|nr:tetratricopeptide repeat protein [Streptosporangium sp. NBC_01755]WSD00740.1 tetratricopeptide repeat protein [Streptosporangium sp. NBC_01755]